MKTPEPSKENPSAPNSAKFTGTDNPRHLRAITALMRRPLLRTELGDLTGCINTPDMVAELRRRGLDLPCERINFIDRDGRGCRPGVYSMTLRDRRKVLRWLVARDRLTEAEERGADDGERA
jgi:hypothetical protein